MPDIMGYLFTAWAVGCVVLLFTVVFMLIHLAYHHSRQLIIERRKF